MIAVLVSVVILMALGVILAISLARDAKLGDEQLGYRDEDDS